MPFLARLALPVLLHTDPELAHHLALLSFRVGLGGRSSWDKRHHFPLATQVAGIDFPNPIGLAAGFDKNAAILRPLAEMGFGFVEGGTVTPRPQKGNPKPRLFRLKEDRAIINRMGFNNAGIDKVTQNLARLYRPSRAGKPASALKTPIGVNIGINKEGAEPLKDYPYLVGRVKPYADYIVMNVSSPNTPGLRNLQQAGRLRAILDAIHKEHPSHPPLFVKLAPDIEEKDVASIVTEIIAGAAQGVIVSNTTLQRPISLISKNAQQTGGLSGRPLKSLSRSVLRKVAIAAEDKLALIGVGGIETGMDIVDKVMNGADLVQIYTAFIYEGPAVLDRLKKETLDILNKKGFSTLEEAKNKAF